MTHATTETDTAAAAPAPPGRFMTIAFFGHLEHTGYVTEVIAHGGRAVYHIDLPEKLWGGNADAEIEYSAEALFSRYPVSEAAVRTEWETELARREAWRRHQEQLNRPALPLSTACAQCACGGSEDGPEENPACPVLNTPACSSYTARGCGCGPTEECDTCRNEEAPF